MNDDHLEDYDSTYINDLWPHYILKQKDFFCGKSCVYDAYTFFFIYETTWNMISLSLLVGCLPQVSSS